MALAGISAAGAALDLGGPGAVPNETEEQRRKRLAALQATQSRLGSPLGDSASLSPAAKYLSLGGFGM